VDAGDVALAMDSSDNLDTCVNTDAAANTIDVQIYRAGVSTALYRESPLGYFHRRRLTQAREPPLFSHRSCRRC